MSSLVGEVAGGVDALEERMKTGGQVPPGKYMAQLIGAQHTESKQKGTPGWELVFKITDGPFLGSEVRDTIYETDNAKSVERLRLFAYRLGITRRTADGKGFEFIDEAKKSTFMDVLDTPCVIEVKHEPNDKNPDRPWTRLDYAGVWPIGHPDLKGVKLGPTPPKAAAAAGGTKSGTAASTNGAAAGTAAKPDEKKQTARGEL